MDNKNKSFEQIAWSVDLWNQRVLINLGVIVFPLCWYKILKWIINKIKITEK